MLRFAISDGRSALDSPPTQAPPSDPSNNACHSDPRTSEGQEPPYFALPPIPLRTRLLAQAASLAAQNIDFFLLREPTLPSGELATIAREILLIFAPTRTRLLLHSRADIAAATGAHGVHLPSSHDALTPTQVRTVYAAANRHNPTISLSCHTEEDLRRAKALRPNLILFGPIFGKQIDDTLIQPGIGLEALRAACLLAHPIPILALGGLTEANTPACLKAGAAGIAAIRLFAQLK